MAEPTSKDGLDSGSITLVIICQLLAPMDWAASITPKSISLKEDSIKRATNGAALTTNGTMVALAPKLEPVIN